MNESRARKLRNLANRFVDASGTEELKKNLLQAFPFWIASLLTGLVAVGYAKLFGYTEDLLLHLLDAHHLYIFFAAPVCFLIAWYIIRWAPAAKGSGIPQVMAAIDATGPKAEQKIDFLLGIRIAIVKTFSSLFMVLGGGAIGREGPTIQIAGSIFRVVNRFIPKSWPQLGHKNFILTGAAAGLAAAFNTPLGGIVFAIEELAKIHLSHLRTALFTAVIIAGLTAQGLLGPYLYLGYPDVRNLPLITYAGVIVTAIIAGLFGASMGKLILKIMKWRSRFTQPQSVLFIVSVGMLIAGFAFFVDDVILGSGKELMNELLFTKSKAADWKTVLARVLGPALCFNIGAAGGVFAPSLAAGAAIGGWMVNIFEITVNSQANILVLSGMVGFLTGVTRTPFTSAILVLEMTDRHSVIFHLMVASLVSNIAALIIDKRSLYDHLKKTYE